RDQIRPHFPRAFYLVAGGTRQPQILFLRRPSKGLRAKMLDLHFCARDRLCAQAIAAAVAGLFGHPFSQRLRDTRAHVCRISSETSWPRCFSSAADLARTSIILSPCATR